MVRRVSLVVAGLVIVAGCGGGDGGSGGGAGTGVESPCELADAALVQDVFGGTVAPGEEGVARNCEFVIEGGSVPKVNIYEFGPAAQFDGVRSGYEDNRGGTVDVAGIGDEAFYPKDTGPLSIIATAGGQNFSVNAFDAFEEAPRGTDALVEELAKRIAARLEG
jgi:hypothetical protein